MTRLIYSILFTALMLWTSAAGAATEKRVALVIGNSTYVHTSPLPNPSNDARDVAGALKRLGFKVIEGIDLDQQGMRDKVRLFSTEIEGAAVALFYYAGHGLQVSGSNYLAPVNAKLQKEGDLDFETIPLNFILRQMERERRTNIVFLDACRDNPLAQQLSRNIAATRSTAVSSGLARVESGIGMLIGYSTSPGDVAFDGQGRNSPYTKALLTHMEKPGKDINTIMISVRQDVLVESKGKQVPWEHSSLTGQFFFKAEQPVAAVTPPPPPPAPIPTPSDLELRKIEGSEFQAAVNIGTCGAYRAFEEKNRGTFYGRLAEEHLRANCEGGPRKVNVEEKPDDKKQTPPPAVEVKTPPVQTPPPVVQTPPQQPVAQQPQKPADKTVVAAIDPGKTPPAPDSELKGQPLIIAIQQQLERVGCAPGNPDGNWGGKSRDALTKFSQHSKIQIVSTEPTATLLATLQGYKGRACPLDCGPQYIVQNEQCVKKICAPGQVLTGAGQCVVQAPKAPVAQQQPQVRERPTRGPKQDEFWGGEDTRIMCQSGREISAHCFPKR